MRKENIWAYSIAGLMIVALLGWCSRPIDLSVTTLLDNTGYIESGNRFGVHVGMSLAEAEQSLVERRLYPLHPIAQSTVAQCEGHIPLETQTIKSFLDRSWRNGMICLMIERGRVVGIGWQFVPGTP